MTTSRDDDAGLAALLRRETHAIHMAAERTGFVADLLRGAAAQSDYALFMRNLLPAYQCLERSLELRSREPVVACMARQELYRSEAIARDLEVLAGLAWESKLPLLEAGAAYVARIAAAAEEASGGALLAHAYVRYFGDLSGGQILARRLALRDDASNFYRFPGIVDPSSYKAALRMALDAAGRLLRSTDLVAKEAVEAFGLNMRLSEAVSAADAPVGL